MQNKQFDGIRQLTIIKRKIIKRPLLVDSLIKIRRGKTPQIQSKLFQFWPPRHFSLPLLAGLVLIFMSFGAGAYFTWHTEESLAQTDPGKVQPNIAVLPVLPVVKGATALGPIAQVPNEILFSLTLDQLEAYLAENLKTPEMQEAERLEDRKFKLKIYLDEKQSPLIGIADTLATLKHWKLVLAISNSESTLGKRCHSNNCSGIGVEPGHPLWRTYDSKAEWAKDLDKLLEKRYKDWTLEEMNGVYVQPGSKNWILAARQILEELQGRGIE